jgi:hypothetical protein
MTVGVADALIARLILRRPVSQTPIALGGCSGYGDAVVLLRRAIVVLAVLVVMTTTGLRLASASARDSVAHCCCGDHSVSDECGCPDCPAGRGHRHHAGPAQATIDRCFVEGSSALISMLVVQIAAPNPAITPPYEPPR